MTTVPYRLRRAEETAPAAALLLLSEQAADLLALLARVGADPWPPVFAVPGAFLVKLTRPAPPAVAPALRLRALAENLFVPADAELEPALLPDEAAGLSRSRGLVFLPGGRVLGFAPGTPLTPAALLEAPRPPARAWEPLPPRPARAEQLREVLLDRPDDAADVIVETGGGGIGGEEPRPDPSGFAAGAAGHAAAAVGRGLLWLANQLRWRGLARLAARIVGAALARVPRVSEALLGAQEAALRALLREFREGDLERALRRALPLGGGADRGSAPAPSAYLPSRDTRFSLRDLLADGRGPAAVWFGGGNVQALLAAEYRKAAEAAAARGDHRRAAYIYGKLLRDYRLAAATLERGGLYHEAAVLYLEKVGDPLAAARAFAAAGEVDRALRIYRERGEHALAGDLLRRAGDEEGALAEYTLAAEQCASRGDYLSAGDLMQKRAGRDDLALGYFLSGWGLRPALATAVPCLLRLTDLYGNRESPRELLALADEADVHFGGHGNEAEASQYYDQLTRVAERPHLAPLRDDLRDRSLRGIAARLRRRAADELRPGTAVSSVLGRSGLWDAAVVSDAEFAFGAAVRTGPTGRPPRGAAAPVRVKLLAGTVTAACAATDTGVLFVGFGGGAVVAFDPASGSARTYRPAEPPAWPVAALSTDARGRMMVALRMAFGGEAELSSYLRTPPETSPVGFVRRATRRLLPPSGCALTPIRLHRAGEYLVAHWDGRGFELLAALELTPLASFGRPCPGDSAVAALLVRPPEGERFPAVLYGRGRSFFLQPFGDASATGVTTAWSPALPAGSGLFVPPLSRLKPDRDHRQLAGVGKEGVVCFTELKAGGSYPVTSASRWTDVPARAATLLSAGRLAAVTDAGVVWLRHGNGRLSATACTRTPLADAVACFPAPRTNELLVVCKGGDLVRVPLPQ